MSIQSGIDRIITAVGAAYDAVEAKGGTAPAAQTIEKLAAAVGTIQTGIVPQLVVTVSAGATVTATNGSKTISGTSDSTGVCTLIVPEIGTWSVSATLDGKTSDTKSVSITDSYAVALTFSFVVSPTLNDNEWEVIKSVSDKGQGANYWSIGDRKEITLNGTVGTLMLSNYTTYVFIIGFNHNASAEGENRIHFQLAKTALSGGTDVCLCDNSYGDMNGGFRMNTNNTSSGGWKSSKMRTAICGTSLSNYSGTIIAIIPAALRAVLKSATKYTNNIGKSTSADAITATTDYFFLLSEYEVFGAITTANSNESSKQAQYAYYSAGNKKIKYRHNSLIAAAFWWLRSPVKNYNGGFALVGAGGTTGEDYAGTSYGFAPGFCV